MTAQELKNSVLRRAFRGELVERRVEEGTGAELLKQIEAEKASLTKAGKLKKEKPLPPITDEEKPFEIPEHWTWTRLGSYCFEVFSGKTPKYSKIPNQYLIIGQAANQQDGIDFSQVKYANEEFWNSMEERYFLRKNDVLLNTLGNGTIGRSGIIEHLEKKLLTDGHLFVFRLCADIASKYFYYYLQYKKRDIEKSANGSTNQIFLSLRNTNSWLVPLPPLAEQARIVAKLEEIWPEIERYAAARDELEALNRRFPTDLRKAVLQSAIRGELIERRDEEGTGAELLKQIEAEKASLTKAGKLKKEKPLPPITEEEKPFEIPEHWTWVRLPFIANMCLGKMLDKQKNTGDLAPYLRNVNVRWGDFDLSDLLEMRFEDCSDDRFLIQKNDLVMCEGGEPGRCAIWTRDEPIHFQKALHRIRFYPPLLPNFYYYLCSLYTANGIFSQLFTGSTIKHLTGQSLEKICVPLPPLAEQARIVAKLEEILPLCDRLR